MNELAKSRKKLPRLSPRHHKFVEAYLTGQSIRQSAIIAGYSERSASSLSYRLMDNNGIAAHILYHQQLANEELQIKLKDVVPFLRDIRDNNKDRPQVVVSACAELAKIGRLYTDQADADSRPAFVGISINMGKGTVKMVSVDSSKDKTGTIDLKAIK